MSPPAPRHLYLPARDRSFWTAGADAGLPLLYLAWGARNFQREPVPPSRHDGWVCVLIEEGGPTMLAGGRAVRLSPGTLAVIGPDCPFGWSAAAAGPSRFRLWMWRALSPAGRGRALGASSCDTRRLPRRDWPAFLLLHDLCRREVLRAARPGAAYLEGCRILFEATLQRAMRDAADGDADGHAGAAAGADLPALARAWIAAHLDSREPIARLCDYLNVSQSTLYRLFAAHEGIGPLAYVQRARMARARELLAGGEKPVTAVASAVGFEHANDFSRAYRRWFGEPPSATRGRARREGAVPVIGRRRAPARRP